MVGKQFLFLFFIKTILCYEKYKGNYHHLNGKSNLRGNNDIGKPNWNEQKIDSSHSGINKYSIEELMYTRFPRKVSDDIYTDPCKAEFFIQDVAFPNRELDKELRIQKKRMNAKKQSQFSRNFNQELFSKISNSTSLPLGNLDTAENSTHSYVQNVNSDPNYKNRNGKVELPSSRKHNRRRYMPRGKKSGDNLINKHLVQLTATENESPVDIYRPPSNDYDVNDNFLTGMYRRVKKIRHRRKNLNKKHRNNSRKTSRKRHGRHKERRTSQSRKFRKRRARNGFPKVKSRARRAATARKERVWDFGVIPYEIDSNFTGADKGLFKQAMRHWENYTCVKFVEKTDEHENYIIFTERECGCCSFVGKRGNGPQALSIGKNCDKFGIVVHELGHVVGFWHEHTRPDRDDNVVIIRENIQEGQDYNFNKLTSAEVNSLGQIYDYNSIMHYARATFAKATYLDTILPRGEPGQTNLPEIGQRVKLSDGDIAQTNLLYKCPKCGRTYQENAASFRSPLYKNAVAPSGVVHCEWRITATHGERIVLNITSLDIRKSEGCKSDYLEVRDGYWHKSPSLGRFCGTINVPYTLKTSTSRMLVSYVSSTSQDDKKGFTASYEAVCGGTLEMEEGILESPNYPNDYRPNKECVWLITVPEDYQVAIRFHSFEIEKHDNCVYDFLNIRDGHDENSTLIGVYCGYKIPDDIKSTGNKMRIKFVTDGSVQKAGFSATFMKEYDECQTVDHGCEHECINQLGGYECQCKIGFELHSDGKRCEDACGGFINASNGTITSPSFPDLYPVNKKCIWEIIAPPQYRITLNFTHFDLEGNNQDCEYDSLDIQSKMGDSEMRRHGVFCGQRLPSLLTSEGNSLRVEFNSDNSVQKSGFAAVFFTDKDECATDSGGCQHICKNTIGSYACSCHNGYTLHENGHDCKEGGCKHEISSPVGEIFSPNYPDYYPSRKECVWLFSTTPGHRIKLVFDEFEMEPHQECTYDHIKLFDGSSTKDPVLGRYCGAKIPHPIVASSSHMYMVFKSDSSVQRKGFRAKHNTVCGGHLQAVSTVRHMYSHSKFGDQNYDNKEECDWIIEAPPLHRVLLTFLMFEIEDEQECGYDFVEVFSGYDDTSHSYGKFCGNRIPPEIASVGEALLVRFASDDTINTKGFSAAYVAIPDDASHNDVEDTFSYSFSRGYV